ncbi:MAG: hypothetical protein ACYC8S_02340 [Minisyncoccota bacterium]
MDALAKSDIFFFITSVAVVAVSIALVVALVYFVRVLRDVKEISARVKNEAGRLAEDVATLRSEVRTQGARAKEVTTFWIEKFRPRPFMGEHKKSVRQKIKGRKASLSDNNN